MAVTTIGPLIMKVGTDVGAFLSGLSKANRAFVSFGATLQVTGFRILSVWTASVGAIGGIAIKAAADFESAFVGIRKTVEGTEGQLKKIEEGMKGLSREIPLTVVELSKIAETAGQLGVRTEDIVSFTETIAKLGVTTDIVGEQGSAQLARFANVTGRANTDFERLGDVIVDLGNNFAATESEILDFGLGLAGAGRLVGLSQDKILAIGTALASVGARAQAGTTAVQTTFQEMQKAVAQGGKRLELFAKVARLSSAEFSEAFREDASQALAVFLEGLNKLGEGQAFVALKDLGLGSRRTVREILKLALGVDQLKDSLARAADQMATGGALSEEARKRFETFTSQLILLKNEFLLIAAELGGELIPIIRSDLIPLIKDLGEKALSLVRRFAALEPETKKLVLQFSLLVPLLGGLSLAVGSVVSLFAALFGLVMQVAGGVALLGKTLLATSVATLIVGKATTQHASTLALMGSNTGIAKKAVSGLGRAMKGLGVIALAVGVFWAAFKLTDWILEITGARKALNKLAESILGIERTAEGRLITPITKEDLALLKAAEEKLGTIFSKTRQGVIAARKAMFKYNMAIRNTSKAQEEAGDTGEGLGDTVDDLTSGFEGLSTAVTQVSETFSKLTRAGLAQAVGDFIDGVSDALSKGEVTEAFRKKFLDGFISLYKELEGEPGLQAALKDFAENSGIFTAEAFTMAFREAFEKDNPFLAMGRSVEEQLEAIRRTGEKGLKDLPKEVESALKPIEGDIDVITKSTINWDKALRDVADTFKVLGVDTSSTLGILLGSITAIMSGVERMKEAWEAMAQGLPTTFGELKKNLNNVLSLVVGIGQAIAGVFKAAEGGAASGALAGALAGGQIGEMFGGPIGAAIGAGIGAAAGAILGALRKPEFKKIMEEVGRDWGITISEELAKAIEETADRLDLGRFEASLLHFSAILSEAGGLSADNLEQFTDKFNDLINAVAMGVVPAAEGMKALNEGFTDMVAGLEDMGVKGAVEIGKLINRFKELGIEVAAANDLIVEKATSAIASLSTFFDFLLEKEQLTTAEASAAVTQVAAAFSAALQATGNLFEAFQMLPENFGEIIKKLREVLGTENQVLNAISRYYNFTKNNEEILAAIGALGSAFMDLLTIGVITKDNILDFAASFKTSFADLIASTENEKMALIAIGPQIGMLLEGFRELGTKPPKWLQDLATEAEAAGASLIPPEGLPDILKDIREILASIADALGAVASEAANATNELNRLGNANIPSGPGGRFENSPEFAQEGLNKRISQPTMLVVGEAGPEDVVVTPVGRDTPSGGGDGPVNVTLVLDGEVLGRFIGTASKDGRLRISPTAVQEF